MNIVQRRQRLRRDATCRVGGQRGRQSLQSLRAAPRSAYTWPICASTRARASAVSRACDIPPGRARRPPATGHTCRATEHLAPLFARMSGVVRTTEVIQPLDQTRIGGLGGGVCLHRDGAITRAFEIFQRLRWLVAAEIVERQHLSLRSRLARARAPRQCGDGAPFGGPR